jgi:transcriptional regulator with XRE-family HTH domain
VARNTRDFITVDEHSTLGKFQGAEIKRLAEFIYGPRFAEQLARKMGLHPSTVRRWVREKHSPTPQHSLEFAAIVRKKRGERVHYELLLFTELAHVADPELEAILLIPFPLPAPAPSDKLAR